MWRNPLKLSERISLWQNELKTITSDYIIGADEVGYGSVAGAVCVCALGAFSDWSMDGLNDSKQLSPKRRKELSLQLEQAHVQQDVEYAIVERSNECIDAIGISAALNQAFIEAIGRVIGILADDDECPTFTVILDGSVDRWKSDRFNAKLKTIVKADNFVPTVMAASILAKTYRDEQMTKLAEQYPAYNWNKNVGYPTPDHKAALEKFGITPLHRKSYEPVKSMVKQ
jgi:ribonuclease HII